MLREIAKITRSGDAVRAGVSVAKAYDGELLEAAMLYLRKTLYLTENGVAVTKVADELLTGRFIMAFLPNYELREREFGGTDLVKIRTE